MEIGISLAKDLLAANNTAGARACQALPPGHMRRIFYAVPTTDQNPFGLAYEEVDENGNIAGPAATDVTPFDQMKDSICLPLGPGNTPVYERWKLGERIRGRSRLPHVANEISGADEG